MDFIKKTIEDNRQKLKYLKSYLTLNEVAMERVNESNIVALNELSNKKRALITSINVLDDKIINDIDCIKSFYKIKDLSELSPDREPKLKDLKEIATEVLRKMVDVKKSDEMLFRKMDVVFDDYKNEKGKFDRSKLEVFTNGFFNS